MSSPEVPEVPAAPGAVVTGPVIPDPAGDERFARGHMSEQATEAYTQTVTVGEAKPELPPEEPATKAARLRRRRRLLAIGAVPAALTTLVSIWLVAIAGLTLSGSHAAQKENYDLAVSRFATVEWLDPWLGRWRVLYNLGTAEALAHRGEDAVAHLTQAVERVPKAKQTTNADGQPVLDPRSDECKVRRNLYAAYFIMGQYSSQPMNPDDVKARAEQALSSCEPPPQSNQQPTAPPSATPTATPTSTSTPTSSAEPSETPTAEPSQDPSATPSSSPSPSQDPSATPSASAEPSATASASPSPSPEPSPDPQATSLASRNAEANDRGKDRSGKRPNQPW
ncbi:Uncharacterised protein [Actinomyces bovis]|uniref:Uncharacterized protein n=1 Tax=Actinomyces bovis TaxID=1658 RepID=A0ABY1VPI5_9ACTO|nr:hypothetical protein [Actinomyces bovis]SPT53582.1 Uncharacterised protein [Actinomyces bovis]VEG55584.1 Uncharacterised protein [Actinomyces israelii]